MRRTMPGGLSLCARISVALWAIAAVLESPRTQNVLQAWSGEAGGGDGFGRVVAGLGDVDGDGIADAGIGAPSTRIGGKIQVGRAFVYSGATGAQIFVSSGSFELQNYGQTVVGPGDITGDGRAEFLVGGVSGFPSPWLWLCSGLDGSVLRSFVNHSTAAAPGDIDNDNIPDLLVADPMATVNGMQQAGRADLVTGLSCSTVHSFTGTFATQAFGTPRAAGDVDGDGVPDILIGAQGVYPVRPSGIWVHSGQTGGLIYHVPPPAGSDSFPLNLDGVGDVNGDGFDDVAVHDHGPLVAPTYYQVNVYGGPDGRHLFTLDGPSPPHASFGQGLAGAGDIDGDGHGDILVGGNGEVFIFSGRDQSILVQMSSPVAGRTIGVGTVASMEDVDGDDFPDYLVGGLYDPSDGTGYVHLHSGAPDGVSAFGQGCPDDRGIIPRIGQSRPAAIGTTVALNLTRTRPGVPAALVLGLSNTQWGLATLPFDMGIFGLPGCSLLVSTEVLANRITQGVPGRGWASVSLPVPDNPAFVGGRFYAQWLVADPAGHSVTRGLEIVVQDRPQGPQ